MALPLHVWFEPVGPGTDLDAGLCARVADPIWFLTRQWQLGEHQGEDASSPVAVRIEVSHVPLTSDGAPAAFQPTARPAETIVEAETGEWWTIGRRVRLGRAAEPSLPALDDADRAKLRFGDLPAPYDALAGAFDGQQIHAAGLLPGSPIWDEVPLVSGDAWSPEELSYTTWFSAGETSLDVIEHDGGDVDWFSVDGPGGEPPPTPDGAPASLRTVLPGRLTYPGAPHPRWWQIEDHAVDIGGFAPDRSHLGTMLLYEIALAHSDDWFWFPVPSPALAEGESIPPPSSGVVTTIHTAAVRDSFDETWDLEVPLGEEDPQPPDAPAPWSLFRTTGIDRRSLIVWPAAVAPHAGPLLDDVVLGVDEDANLAWAVELRAEGLELNDDASSAAAGLEVTPTGSRVFEYRPSTTLPQHWHPYRRQTQPSGRCWWEQGLVADLTQVPLVPRAGPTSRLIGGVPDDPRGAGHIVEVRAIPSSGVRIQRRARLARDVDGRPVLWVERRATPILAPPASHLRFDVFVETPRPTPAPP